MLVRPALLLAVACGLVAGPAPSPPAAAQPGGDWKLTWADEFDGTGIDPAKWDFDLGNGFFNYDANQWIAGWGNNELQYYTKEPGNAFVKDGSLHVRAVKESYQGCGYTSARLRSKKRDGSPLFAQRYGKFEFKAKLPTGKGVWPALWMLPQDEKYGPWPTSGEIDVMEARGQEPTKVLGTLHYGSRWPGNVHSGKDYVFPEGQSIADWHTYAVEWEPGEIRWAVDGKTYQTQSFWWSSPKVAGNKGVAPAGEPDLLPWPAPFDQPFYLVMNVAVGGQFLGNPDRTTPFPAEMLVDCVRVYEKPGGYGPAKTPRAGAVPVRQTVGGVSECGRGGKLPVRTLPPAGADRMPLPKLARAAALSAVTVLLASLAPSGADAQKKTAGKKADPARKAEPRPKRPELPPSALPLALTAGERIALVGNSTAERMNLFGNFEAMLHRKFADKKLVVRNFGRPADEVAVRQRSADYTKIDDPFAVFGADTILCFFGFNESFAGKEGVAKFEKDYERFLDDYSAQYPRDGAGSKPRFVLVSPVAFEEPDPKLGMTDRLPVDQRFLPTGKAENENLKLYAAAVKAVADRRKLAFVDVFAPTLEAFQAQPGLQFTINGCHLNDQGDALLARVLMERLFGGPAPAADATLAQLRAAVVDKAFVHQQDYRMLNGWYVYGGRRTYDTETFPKEFGKLRAMAALRDQYVWDIAALKQVSAGVDDSKTGELYTPPTRFGDPRQKYSENPGELKYQTPEEFVRTATVAPGLEIRPFADETKFPEIAKPVQLGFDNKGRLWVACMPNYPLWKPGDPKPNDKLVILEDTDGDGKADKSTVFYDQLHCPTGFEFWNGGVLVMDQPRILWLKDTDGDGKADLVVHLFDGWASDDTHHRGGWEWGPGGYLHLLEGIAMSTTLETPWGPHRSQGAGGSYVIDPRNQRVRQFSLPGMYNMWCYVFDEWGQGIVGDGTTANQTWDTPLSGAQFQGRKGINFILPNGERPNLGSEWLVSRALPDDLQKQFIYACVINLNGMPRYTVKDDGAGFMGSRVKGQDGKWSDLLKSPDKHFRPADPHIGPDGALWFGDWANALIGHMQYSQRDPNRDHTRGRVYRIVGKDKPLLTPVTQFAKSVPELLNQFTEYEWRTRYNARRELRDRPTAEVLAATSQWVAKLDPNGKDFERLRCEALWVQQGHHAVQPELLKAILGSKAFEARAAGVRVAADDRLYIPDALAILKAAATDPHPRVRTEALRGLSFFNTADAIDATLAAAKLPLDYWTKYTLEATLGATEATWRPLFLAGKVKDNPQAEQVMNGIIASSKTGGAAAPHLRVLLSAEPQPAEVKNRAMTALAGIKGNATNGRAVFTRGCIACHKVGNGDGQDYGPNLAGVGAKMPRTKIIESIIDPNAEVDAKYASTRIVTVDGKTVTGLVVAENKTDLAIFDGMMRRTIKLEDIDTRLVLKQSSMPEGQAAAMAPSEFVDLIEYLDSLKSK